MKVLVMDAEPSLREMLAYVLTRQGVDVDMCTPEELDARVDTDHYDAIVFNAHSEGQTQPPCDLSYRVGAETRLICFGRNERDPAREEEVDAYLPFPFSSSELLGALLGLI